MKKIYVLEGLGKKVASESLDKLLELGTARWNDAYEEQATWYSYQDPDGTIWWLGGLQIMEIKVV